MFVRLRKLPAHLYYRARWYDAEAGRFISRDSIGVAGGINLYGYLGIIRLILQMLLGIAPMVFKELFVKCFLKV